MVSESSCCICHRVDNEDMILLCDGEGCSHEVHMYCLDPELQAVPRGKWLCPECDKDGTTARLRNALEDSQRYDGLEVDIKSSLCNSFDIIGLPLRTTVGRTSHHGRILNRRPRTSRKPYCHCKYEHLIYFARYVKNWNIL